MEYGTVKWFSNQKGYGFIEREDGGQDAFVHYSDIEEEGWKSLEEDQKVQFELEETDEGPRAKDISKIEEFPESAGTQEEEDSEDASASEDEDDESLEPPEAFQSTGPAVDSEEEADQAGDEEESEDPASSVDDDATPVTPSSVLEDEEAEEENDEEDTTDEERETSTDW